VKPTVGRVVHYVSHGTPGGEYTSECRAAIVTEVNTSDTVGLCVLKPTGQFFNRTVVHDEGSEALGDPDCPDRANHGRIFRYCACGWAPATKRGGTWHWPERDA